LLSEAEWERVRSLFTPPPADPREERARAARAVGMLGEWFDSGTWCDSGGNEPFSAENDIRKERARADLLARGLTLGPGQGAKRRAMSSAPRGHPGSTA